MHRPHNGFSRRRGVSAPDFSLFRHPVDFNNVGTFPDSDNPHVRSLSEDLGANWYCGARLVEGDNDTVWIGALHGGNDRAVLTNIADNFDIWLLPDRVVEHVAPDPGRVCNQNANLFLFQRIALGIVMIEARRYTRKAY